jgi:HTH domain
MSNTLSGDPDVALRALLAMQAAAVGAGATRIIVNLEVEDRAVPDVEFVQALAQALGPAYRVSLLDNDGAIQAMFGTVSGDAPARTVIPFTRSSGALVLERERDGIGNGPGAVGDDPRAVARPSFMRVDQALTELIAECESEIGRPLEEMTRAEKRQVVRFLDQRGAFALRKSVETVADALGVSRFTVYNYLDTSRRDSDDS